MSALREAVKKYHYFVHFCLNNDIFHFLSDEKLILIEKNCHFVKVPSLAKSEHRSDYFLTFSQSSQSESSEPKKILENSTLHSLMTFADFFPLFQIQTQCSLPYLCSYHSFVYVSDRTLTSDPCCP